MKIKSLRLLPPLAFARLGSALEPQPSYELEIDAGSLGFREIRPGTTLLVGKHGKLAVTNNNNRTANHSAPKRAEINKMFRDGPRIRPVAPFFELFAILANGKVRPVTLQLLKSHNLRPSDISWAGHVENRKVFRRTGDEKDKVVAKTRWFSDHARKRLIGNCKYLTGPINFGYIQYIKPAVTDKINSQIRLRFTPARGKIFGPIRRRPGVPDDASYVTPIYEGGSWPYFNDEKHEERGAQPETLPPSLYANTNRPPAAPWLNHDPDKDRDIAESRGYLDDVCDGFICVKIESLRDSNGEPLQAKARICVGPPAFTPDSHFVRTLADDLEQIINGPHANDIARSELRKCARDIIRRAFETVRSMNVAVMNGNSIDGRPAEAFDTMPAEEAFATERPVRPVMAPVSVDTAAVLGLHQRVYAAISSGIAPWFLQLLRQPNEVGDLTDHGRRKMPALMSGADSFYLALTHRQIATFERAASGAISPRNRTAQTRMAQRLTEEIRHRAVGNPVTSRPEMAIANCCPGLEVDFRAVWRRLFEGIELSEHENLVVKTNGTLRDVTGKELDLKGHRLLRVGQWEKGRKFQGIELIVTLKGESPAGGKVTVKSSHNPHGVITMEWSNCLAYVIERVQRRKRKQEWCCEFTADPAPDPQPAPKLRHPKDKSSISKWVKLRAQKFFEGDTAVISKDLAEPGELTQGLCSPWQNDLRECSCFYWAGSRPDFVNTKIESDGLTHGDNWFARERSGEYVLDDYADPRLLTYDDLFEHWELLQFQIGGEDSAPDLTFPLRRQKR